MGSFTRFAAVAVVVLSLGFLVASAPVTSYATIPAVTGKDAVSEVCARLFVTIQISLKSLLECTTLADVDVLVQAIVAAIKICADDLLKIDAGVTVSVEATANLATCFGAMITLLVQVCANLAVKFGLKVVIALCADIDVALRVCLLNLEVLIGGILVLIAKAIASVTVGLLAQINLKLCMSVLGL